jgi:hypothetical protein
MVVFESVHNKVFVIATSEPIHEAKSVDCSTAPQTPHKRRHPWFTVKVDGISFGFLPNLDRHVGHRPQAFAVLTATAALSRLRGVRLGKKEVKKLKPDNKTKTHD